MYTHAVQAGEVRVPPVAGYLHLDCSKRPGGLVLEESHRRRAAHRWAPILPVQKDILEQMGPISEEEKLRLREGNGQFQGHTTS